MRHLLPVLLFLSLCEINAQNQFYKTLNTVNVEEGHSIIKGFHKNYWVVGIDAHFNSGEDFLLANYDLEGNLKWLKGYESIYTEQGEGVVLENAYDGGIFLGGYTGVSSTILKLNKNGLVDYKYLFQINKGNDLVTAIIPLEDNQVIIAGSEFPLPLDTITTSNQFILKLNQNGAIGWSKLYGNDSLHYNSRDILNYNNQIISTGVCRNDTIENLYLMNTDLNGVIRWDYRYDGTGKDHLNEILSDGNCGYIGVGTTVDKLSGNSDILFIKFDEYGTVHTSIKIGGAGLDFASHIEKTYDGNYVIGGQSTSFSQDNSESLFLMKVDSVGNILWTKSYGDSFKQLSIPNTSMFTQTADSGFAFTGVDFKFVTGKNILFAKTAKDGQLSCVSFSPLVVQSANYPLMQKNANIKDSTVIIKVSQSSLHINNNQNIPESEVCNVPISSTCGLNAKMDLLHNCGSDKMFLFDRSLNSSPYQFTIQFGDGNSMSGNQNTHFLSYKYPTSGYYQVDFTIFNNTCTSSVSKSIFYFNPLEDWLNKRTFCYGDSVDLSLLPHPNIDYIWRDKNKNIISSSHKLKVSPSDTTLYYVTATNLINCCKVSDSVLLIPQNLQDFTIGNDTVICDGDTIELKLKGDYISIIKWQDGSTDSIFKVTTPGIYYIQVNTTCGPTSDTVIVVDGRLVSDIIRDTVVCADDFYTIHAQHPELNTYLWSNHSTADSLNVTTTGMYYVTVSDQNCTYSDSAYIKFESINPNTLEDTVFICPGQSTILDVTTNNSTYLWSTGSLQPAITVNQQGLYTVEISNICGTYYDSTFVKIVDLSSQLRDTVVCDMDSFQLSINFPDHLEILWSTGDTTSSIYVYSDGIYNVNVQFNDNCTFSDQVNVIFMDRPVQTLIDTAFLCEANNGQINVNVNVKGGSYLWNNGSQSPLRTITSEGLYTVEIQNKCGKINDSIYASIVNVPEVLLDTIICDVDSYIIDATSIGAPDYLWSNSMSTVSIEVNATGWYWVDAIFGECIIRDSIYVEFLKTPQITLDSVMELCGPVVLNVYTEGATYKWSDNSTSSSFLIENSSIISVEVENTCGSDFKEIEVEIKDCQIILPNIFSPNSDGINDTYIVHADYGSWSIKIFDRWGHLVFDADNASKVFWDGRNQIGYNCSEGTYFVVLTQQDGDEKYTANVVLTRN